MLREFIEQLDKLPQKVFANSLLLDADKPTIGIVTAQNDLSLANRNLSEIVDKVQQGIVAAGGQAKVLHVPSIEVSAMHATTAAKYDLPTRDLIAEAVEMFGSSDYLDGMVFVASTQNVVCGMLLGAIRLNIPCAFVSQGVMSPVRYNNAEYGYSFYYEQIAKVKTGKTPYDLVSEIRANLPLCVGTDCDNYGENSLNCLLEVCGLAVKGNGTAAANTAERMQIAYRTGKLAVERVADKCTAKRLLSQTALTNMVCVDIACGGYSTTMLNLIAVANELGIRNVNFKTIGELAKSTPVLLKKDKATECLMPQFHRAGGVYAVVKQMIADKIIDGTAYVAEDQTLVEQVKDSIVTNNRVITPSTTPVCTSARLRVVKGNVAEEGAFVQNGAQIDQFSGVCKVYSDEEMAIEAILHKEIKRGDVVVIRGEGAKNAPGMREIYTSLALLNGLGIAEQVAVITDGRIADIYKGIAVGHITPEFGSQSAFTVLRDGDTVEIVPSKMRISCDVNAREVQMRLRTCERDVGNYGNVFLRRWAANCAPPTEGCVQKK